MIYFGTLTIKHGKKISEVPKMVWKTDSLETVNAAKHTINFAAKALGYKYRKQPANFEIIKLTPIKTLGQNE